MTRQKIKFKNNYFSTKKRSVIGSGDRSSREYESLLWFVDIHIYPDFSIWKLDPRGSVTPRKSLT